MLARLGVEAPGARTAPGRATDRRRSYLGADGVVDLLAALHAPGSGPVTLPGDPAGPVVTVHPASGREAPPASTRHVSGLVADPAPASRGARVEPGPGWLVVAQAGLAERVPADVVAAGATVVHLDDHRPVEEQADLPADAVFAHVRVLADLRGGSGPTRRAWRC
ncbi:hypothetical protein GCM10025868_21740 [Angustibacter aerolatus]|uniref:Uncharacterized protein n=1 Tax=Angustibacter aerolatus TaxID=1162965 RepID=A0ABQ6JGK8_9ACTN|nr:hypothetical protein [Angustibacter aerolatus]GMA86924.1 hypothetical protein GCM10025868_21740 [Angustibacter aerolatus]